MDFLNVGPWELVVVLIIAILVAGPKRMVEIARTLGQFSRQLRDMSREFTMALQAEIDATEQEAGSAGAELREVQRDLEDAITGTLQQASGTGRGPDAQVEPDTPVQPDQDAGPDTGAEEEA